MAAAGAGDMLRGVYEGSITGSHTEVPRRPYHKNCTCALHGGPRGGKCPQHKTTTVSYPINRSWSEGSLVLYADAFASPNHNHNHSPSLDNLPPLPNRINLPMHHHHHNDTDDDDDDDDLFGRNA